MFRQFWKHTTLVVGLTALLCGAAPNPSDLTLRITYTGEGEVDPTHRIWVFVWDTTDFNNAFPIAFASAAANGEEINITGLRASPVFITGVYDLHGGYDPNTAMGPPPPDSPRGAYLGDPMGSAPTPVQLREGENVMVEFSFDDAGSGV